MFEQEHAVAPFFVFQVLCVLLWSLDEYWYYSMFTLVLLVIFESTVCKQRQRSLEMLRAMRRPAYEVFVYREGGWRLLSTEALLPGAPSPPVAGQSKGWPVQAWAGRGVTR
jgi:manganese-transporting P-type ATPase